MRVFLSIAAISTAISVGLVPWTTVAIAAPATQKDAVDPVRQAAEKAIKEGKLDDAIEMFSKLGEEGHATYQDYQQLAKAHEKLRHEREAAAAYRRVLELTSDTSDKREERAAYREAKQKVATLNTVGTKIDAFAKDTEKRAMDLLKEAEKGGDWEAVGKLLKLVVALRDDEAGGSIQYVQVVANKSYQQANYKMVEGKTYRIRAAGRWKLAPRVECGPEGVRNMIGPGSNNAGALVMLVTQGKDNFKVVKVGNDLTWAATISGEVSFVINEEKLWELAGKEDNSGSLHVLIERID